MRWISVTSGSGQTARVHQLGDTEREVDGLATVQPGVAHGLVALVELVVLAGYYGLIGYVLNAFEAELPEGVQPAFERWASA